MSEQKLQSQMKPKKKVTTETAWLASDGLTESSGGVDPSESSSFDDSDAPAKARKKARGGKQQKDKEALAKRGVNVPKKISEPVHPAGESPERIKQSQETFSTVDH